VDLLELGSLQPTKHWYYESKLRAIQRAISCEHLPDCKLLEVGSGSGFFSHALATRFGCKSVIAYDPNYSEAQVGKRDGVIYANQVSQDDIHNADIMLFLDVLEHVADDISFLKTFVNQSRPNTLFIFTVPAFMSLWSGHDEYLGHYRRYDRQGLVRSVESSGLAILSSRYLFVTIFPIAWITRKLHKRVASNMRALPTALNFVLTHILSLEHWLPINRLPGLTAACVAKKPTES